MARASPVKAMIRSSGFDSSRDRYCRMMASHIRMKDNAAPPHVRRLRQVEKQACIEGLFSDCSSTRIVRLPFVKGRSAGVE
jgi:hypothetical protein